MENSAGDIRIDEITPELYSNWLKLPFEDTLSDQVGDYIKLKQKETKTVGIYPVIDQGEDLINGYVDEESLLYNGELPVIIFGDHTRRLKLINFRFAVGADGTKILKPKEFINIHFFFYFLRSLNIASEGYSRHYKFLKAITVPIPPLAEQNRIVSKLDTAFSKIEANQKRLEKIPKLLKRFRQSVLASAVRDFGEDEVIANVCELIQIGPFGTQLHKHDYISNGIPLVNPTHIQGGEIIPDMDLTISKKKFKELSNYHLKTGDVIMGRRGEMARCALVGDKENNWLCGTGSLFFRPNIKKIDPKFLFWILSNSDTRAFLEAEAKGSTMNNLNLTIVKNVPLSLPSLKQQKAIIKKAEKLFAFADKVEIKYTKAKAMLDKLPQSILAKAFRGELVPQDPNDEPAEELLERIKVEKENLKNKGKKSKEQAKKVEKKDVKNKTTKKRLNKIVEA